MIELTADGATKEFKDKLVGKKFTMSRPPNRKVSHAVEKLNRDMAAVDEFIGTDMLEYIKNLK